MEENLKIVCNDCRDLIYHGKDMDMEKKTTKCKKCGCSSLSKNIIRS